MSSLRRFHFQPLNSWKHKKWKRLNLNLHCGPLLTAKFELWIRDVWVHSHSCRTRVTKILILWYFELRCVNISIWLWVACVFTLKFGKITRVSPLGSVIIGDPHTSKIASSSSQTFPYSNGLFYRIQNTLRAPHLAVNSHSWCNIMLTKLHLRFYVIESECGFYFSNNIKTLLLVMDSEVYIDKY